MTKTAGWIFSPKLDALAFVGPILLSLVFTYLYQVNLFYEPTPYYFFAFNIFFNVAHVYSTFWYSYTSPDQWRAHGKWFISIPIIFFATNILMGSVTDPNIILSFFSHFSVWHFVKQQQAWFFISARHEKKSVWENRLDKFAIYAVTWGVVATSQASENPPGWFIPGDLVDLPGFLHLPLLILSIGGFGYYLGKIIWSLFSRRVVNWAQVQIFICASIIWGYARLGPPGVITFHFIQLHHAIPYLILGMRYMQSEKAQGRRFYLPAIPLALLFIGIYGIGLMVGKLEMGMRNGLGFWWHSADLFDGRLSLMGIAFWNSLSLTHYTLDGIMWNRGHNPNWTAALAPTTRE